MTEAPIITPAELRRFEGFALEQTDIHLRTHYLRVLAAARRGVEADKYLGYATAANMMVYALRERAKTAEAERYVPGVWRCAKCKLRLVSTILNVADGNMYADTKPQECAAGCGPMWRVSERDERKEAQALFGAEFDKRIAAETALAEAVRREAHALELLRQAREYTTSYTYDEEGELTSAIDAALKASNG